MYQSQSQQQQVQILVQQQQQQQQQRKPQNYMYKYCVLLNVKVFLLLLLLLVLATLSSSLSLSLLPVKQYPSKQLRMNFVLRTTTARTTLKRSRISSSLSSSQLYLHSSSSFRSINNRYVWLHQQRQQQQQQQEHSQQYQHSSKIFLSSSSYNDYDSNLQSKQEKRNQQVYETKLQQLKDTTKLSLAPMMDYTDRHFRYLVRLISENTLLYTEMVPANAISRERQIKMTELQYNNNNNNNNMYDMSYIQRFIGQATHGEGACILQLGGSDPQQLYEATQCIVEASERSRYNHININNKDSLLLSCDYTGINLNCGCPSPKVANKGCFGAALMDEPNLVAQLVQSIHNGSSGTVPVTVKCRIGTDSTLDTTFTKLSYSNLNQQQEEKEYQKLCNFINIVSESGIVTDYQIHARIAVLSKSFSPADNRKVPPLKYNIVHRLVSDYPQLTFTLNGGIETLSDVQHQFSVCPKLAGIMIGRAWAADPWRFAMTDNILYNNDNNNNNNKSLQRKYNNRYEILQQYGKHADYEEEMFTSIVVRRFLTKAITSLFTGEPNNKQYRIELDTITRNAKLLLFNEHTNNNNNNNNPNNACTSTLGNVIIKNKDYELQNIPISQLILDAATKHLSEDVLFRTPEESYERILWEEEKKRNHQQLFVSTGTSSSIQSYSSTTSSTTTTTTLPSTTTSSTTISLSSSNNSDDETNDSKHSQSNTNNNNNNQGDDDSNNNNDNDNNNFYQWDAVAEWQKERKEEQKKNNNNINSIW